MRGGRLGKAARVSKLLTTLGVLLALACPALALPNSVVVSGAGDSPANGTYTPLVGSYATYGGATQYSDGGGYYLTYAFGTWGIYASANTQSNEEYYASGSTTSLPTGAWTASPYGPAPAPTVSVPSPVTVTGSWSPTTITAGSSAQITWSSSDTTSTVEMSSNGPSTIPGFASAAQFAYSGVASITFAAAGSYSMLVVDNGSGSSVSVPLTVTAAGSGSGSTGSGSTGSGSGSTGSGSTGSGSSSTSGQGASAGCLGSPQGCGAGASTFTDNFTAGGYKFSLPTTLPTTSTPSYTPVLLPGDLGIGIPGIGSFTFPTGWWTQIIAFAVQWAQISTGLTGPVLVQGMNTAANSISTNMTATTQAMTASVDSTINAGDNLVIGWINDDTSSMEANLDQQISPLPPLITSSTNSINSQVNTSEKTGVTDFQTMLTALFQYLFVPPLSTQQQFYDLQAKFLNWGPYTFMQSLQVALNPPPGSGNLGDGAVLGVPNLTCNTTGYAIVLPGYTGRGPLGSILPGEWYAASYAGSTGTGPGANTIPFDFTQVTSLPGWPTFRLFEGAAIWVGFCALVMSTLMPKQTL